ncbi:MAG: hypothetical protein AVDCRST_MAG54-3815, partial [uncultured Actinomycetospora sp.]
GRAVRVLVAHQQQAVRRQVRGWLEPLDYAVDEAADADAVRALL